MGWRLVGVTVRRTHDERSRRDIPEHDAVLRHLKSVEDLAQDGQHAFPILSGSCVERGCGILQLTTPAQICGASQGVVDHRHEVSRA